MLELVVLPCEKFENLRKLLSSNDTFCLDLFANGRSTTLINWLDLKDLNLI